MSFYFIFCHLFPFLICPYSLKNRNIAWCVIRYSKLILELGMKMKPRLTITIMTVAPAKSLLITTED
jgi:hypothetical protein